MQEQLRAKMSRRQIAGFCLSVWARFLIALMAIFWLLGLPLMLVVVLHRTWNHNALSDLIPENIIISYYAILWLGLISTPLAAYCLCVSIRPHNRNVKRVREMTLMVCIGALVFFTLLNSSKLDIERKFVNKLKYTQQQYNWTREAHESKSLNEETILWDRVQETLGCCGLESFEEWGRYWHKPGLPVTCCVNVPGAILRGKCLFGAYYGDSCKRTAEHDLELVSMFGAFIFVQAFLLAFSASLLRFALKLTTANRSLVCRNQYDAANLSNINLINSLIRKSVAQENLAAESEDTKLTI